MKLKNILYTALVALSFGLSGCDFEDENINPNYPAEASTYMQFLYSSRFVKYFVFNSYYYDIWSQEYPGYLAESEKDQYGNLECTTQLKTADYYAAAIRTLNEILDQLDQHKGNAMVDEWGDRNNQRAICRTLRAFFYMSMTDVLGPTPYTESLKGAKESIWTPKFDNTDVIYAGLDKDLCEAYELFNEKSKMTKPQYDIFYQGDVARWMKFNATLRMMMAIKMKDVDPENGKMRFARAYADGGMTDYDDSFTYTYDSNSASTQNFSPMYSNANGVDKASYNYVPTKILVDSLKAYQDPRLFTYCTVSENSYKGKAGAYGDKDFRSFHGVPFGLEAEELASQAKFCCGVGPKYCVQCAKYGVITTARCLLVEAEAAWLGRIEADKQQLYYNGIQASFEFEKYLEDVNLTRSTFTYDLDAYCEQERVKFSENDSTQLLQIWAQRWLAGFLTDGVEAWADWRINNYPLIPVYERQRAAGHETYPSRLNYSDADYNYNVQNCEYAIRNYLGGDKDSRELRIWWDVKPNYSPLGDMFTTEELATYNPANAGKE